LIWIETRFTRKRLLFPYFRKDREEAWSEWALETHPWFGCTKTQVSGLEQTDILHTERSRDRPWMKPEVTAQSAHRPSLRQMIVASFSTCNASKWQKCFSAMPFPEGDED